MKKGTDKNLQHSANRRTCTGDRLTTFYWPERNSEAGENVHLSSEIS